MTITDIVTNIERRLTEARAEVAHLEGARSALLTGSQPMPTPKRRAPRRKPATPRHEVVPAGKLTALLAGTESMRTAELVEASNGARDQVLALLKEQEAAGEVRRTGSRAATRWHVMTDEDRIAVRAAELSAQSRRTRARKT